jgi:hypothetical protein
MVGPVPSAVPLVQLSEYHFHDAPVPSVPPKIVRSVESPRQIVGALADALVGAIEGMVTVTVAHFHSVLLQSPRARTEYSVVMVGFTCMLAPAPIYVPPEHDPEYHSHAAPVPRKPPLMLNVVESPRQMVGLLLLMSSGVMDNVFTVTVTDTHGVLLHEPSALT